MLNVRVLPHVRSNWGYQQSSGRVHSLLFMDVISLVLLSKLDVVMVVIRAPLFLKDLAFGIMVRGVDKVGA